MLYFSRPLTTETCHRTNTIKSGMRGRRAMRPAVEALEGRTLLAVLQLIDPTNSGVTAQATISGTTKNVYFPGGSEPAYINGNTYSIEFWAGVPGVEGTYLQSDCGVVIQNETSSGYAGGSVTPQPFSTASTTSSGDTSSYVTYEIVAQPGELSGQEVVVTLKTSMNASSTGFADDGSTTPILNNYNFSSHVEYIYNDNSVVLPSLIASGDSTQNSSDYTVSFAAHIGETFKLGFSFTGSGLIDIPSPYYSSEIRGQFDNSLQLSQPADITPTTLSFAPDGSLDYGYTIATADLPQATTVDLYWASGTTTDTEIGDPIVTTTTETAQGTYPLNAPASALGTPPAGAKDLLVVADPDNLISPADPSKVAALALVDIEATSLDWHKTSAAATSQDGSPVSSHSMGGGVDFTYQVHAGAVPTDTTVGFYWGNGSTPLEPLDQPLYSLTVSAGVAPNGVGYTNQVTASELMGPDGTMLPPPGSTTLLAIIDPLDTVRESHKTNNTSQLSVTSADIFDNSDPSHPSMSKAAQGPYIYAHFTPVGGRAYAPLFQGLRIIMGDLG